jgi:hypothetical protein
MLATKPHHKLDIVFIGFSIVAGHAENLVSMRYWIGST